MASSRSDRATWTIFRLVAAIAVIHLAITLARAARHDAEDTADREEEGGSSPAADTTAKSHGKMKCSDHTRQKCCRLKPHTTSEGQIRLSKAPCPDKVIMNCCPGLKPKSGTLNREGGPNSPLNVSLREAIKCITDVIGNLLELKLSLIGSEGAKSGCCKIPILKNACPTTP